MTLDRFAKLITSAASLLAILTHALHAQKMPREKVEAMVRERVASYAGGGLVVGVIDREGSYIVADGYLRDGDSTRLDGNTIFEIGSITKLFTSILLADMVQRKEVKLNDQIAALIPRSVRRPSASVRKITLADLASHRSGLPRIPENLIPEDLGNPYVTYTVEKLYQFLATYRLPRKAGTAFEYSNLGAGLLGHLLSLRAGTDYESLVRARICQPLGMSSTSITIVPEDRSRFAQGHDTSGRAVPHWDLPVIAGAGAFRSSVSDMLLFLRAAMGLVDTPLLPAMQLSQEPRADVQGNARIGLGWFSIFGGSKRIIMHNGQTGGFHSFLGFEPTSGVGVIILSNNEAVNDDIAVAILRGS